MRAIKTLPALATVALLAGCVKFGSEPPPSLLVPLVWNSQERW